MKYQSKITPSLIDRRDLEKRDGWNDGPFQGGEVLITRGQFTREQHSSGNPSLTVRS